MTDAVEGPNFATADLCDAHPERVRVPDLAWQIVGQHRDFCGEVSTIKAYEDNSRVREAVAEAGRGRVLLVDGGASRRRAMLGDRLAQLAVDNGWAGVVVVGCIRDRAIIDTLALGVRCLGTHPRKTEKRGAGERDVVVEIGGVEVAPGMWLYADADGVIVAPEALSMPAS